MEMEEVKEVAKKHLEKNERGHGWDHTRRVLKLCERIGEKENADMEVLRLAAILHDIGYHIDSKRHGIVSSELAEDILQGYEKKDEVLHCIRVHRFSKDRKAESLEAEILRDADNLDAMGAAGIARTLMYSGIHGRPVYIPGRNISEEYDGESDTAVQHFHDKLLKIKDRLETGTAKEMGKHRHTFMENFLEELKKEWSGEI